jgi:hypothetical protein
MQFSSAQGPPFVPMADNLGAAMSVSSCSLYTNKNKSTGKG